MKFKWRKNSLWRSLLVGFVFLGTFVFGFYAIFTSEREGDLQLPLRRVFNLNAKLTNSIFKEPAFAKEFDQNQITPEPRTNGDLGLEDALDPATWRLEIEKDGVVTKLTLADIKRLPHFEMTTEFKCIEGWSQVVNWGGARLSDLIATYHLLPTVGSLDEYSVAMATPDKKYFIGLDLATAMHPQTLLAYEMNHHELPVEHGAPLRLATPLKYGIKNIKRIGHLKIVKGRAADYWAEHGYDWDAGH